jgi:hypothetical protein
MNCCRTVLVTDASFYTHLDLAFSYMQVRVRDQHDRPHDRLSDASWTCRVGGDALWHVQCTNYIPADEERHPVRLLTQVRDGLSRRRLC